MLTISDFGILSRFGEIQISSLIPGCFSIHHKTDTRLTFLVYSTGKDHTEVTICPGKLDKIFYLQRNIAYVCDTEDADYMHVVDEHSYYLWSSMDGFEYGLNM